MREKFAKILRNSKKIFAKISRKSKKQFRENFEKIKLINYENECKRIFLFS